MGPHKNSIYIIVFSWTLGLCLIGVDAYYLINGLINLLVHNKLSKVANVFIGLCMFPLMAIYVVYVIYLAFWKDQAVTFVDTTRSDPISQIQTEKRIDLDNDEYIPENIPYLEDLAKMTNQNR